ncbi:MAG TPA: hypothetical protein DEB17_01330 [Chlorobaculum sp.]|uniref:Uncharacterized protein n=1 Tax=Chlorobaculum tepidum (strain ATCC 49652 / DSM 12025 / NBRC 103806 / TLS) TaxID=194439 RepID=Q8KCF3_CHLTE|nr:hypothetical protein CT1469 [Chlorobaculum tepidum TLS]HBU22641.1 hypothetical protein [Chlorobaculum sp.]
MLVLVTMKGCVYIADMWSDYYQISHMPGGMEWVSL